MKNSILLFFCFIYSASLLSQKKNYQIGDTIYYKKGEFSLKENADYYAIIQEKTSIDGKNNFVMLGYKSTKDTTAFFIHSKYNTTYLKVKRRTAGTFINYYKNGDKKSEGLISKKNKKYGKWTYWYKGNKIRKESFIHENKALSKQNYKNTSIQNYWTIDGKQTIKNGNGFFEYKNDTILRTGNVKDGLRIGKWTGYNNNRKYFEEFYKNGKITKGTSWDKEGNEYSYKKAYVGPRFKKGQESIKKHIFKHFVTPKRTNQKEKFGRLYLNFTIDKENNISNIKILKGKCIPCNKEAIRVIKLMKGWKAGLNRGQKTNTKYTLPITYKLE